MNGNVLKVVKLAVTVASIGISLVSSHLASKELDAKVAAKVAEAVAKAAEKES